jgi:hypothetical protein
MPGKKITDHQVQKYKQDHLKFNQAAAAAKAGVSLVVPRPGELVDPDRPRPLDPWWRGY